MIPRPLEGPVNQIDAVGRQSGVLEQHGYLITQRTKVGTPAGGHNMRTKVESRTNTVNMIGMPALRVKENLLIDSEP